MKKKWSNFWIFPLIGATHEALSWIYRNSSTLNPGISFNVSFWGLSSVILAVLIMVLVLWWKTDDMGLMLLAAGGAVNFLDRIRFLGVRDYWLLPGGKIYNNINDWVIFAGIVLIILNYLWKRLR